MIGEKQIKIGNNTFEFQWLKGKVLHVNSLAKTEGGGTIYTHPNAYTSSQINISSIEQLDIFLEDASGEEHSFKLDNFNFSCRAGHEVTVIKLNNVKYGGGPFVGLYNHNTKERRTKEYFFRSMTRPSSTPSWLLGLFLPPFLWIAIFFFSDSFLSGILGADPDSILVITFFMAMVMTVGMWILLIVLYQSKKSGKYNQLRNAYYKIEL
jgi:hypothetical protein